MRLALHTGRFNLFLFVAGGLYSLPPKIHCKQHAPLSAHTLVPLFFVINNYNPFVNLHSLWYQNHCSQIIVVAKLR